MGKMCCAKAAEGHGCGCPTKKMNWESYDKPNYKRMMAEEPVVQEPDWIPQGDGRAVGQQDFAINLSPLHAESRFDKLSKEIAEEYREKGKSPEEAERIGDATAAKIGRAKYGKKGMMKMQKKGMNAEHKSMKISYDGAQEFADEIALVDYSPWESAYDNEVNNIQAECSELYRRIFVWQDGKVNPCDYDYKSTLSKWNANEHSIKKIWNSDYYNEIRRLHKLKERKKIEPCNRCIGT